MQLVGKLEGVSALSSITGAAGRAAASRARNGCKPPPGRVAVTLTAATFERVAAEAF